MLNVGKDVEEIADNTFINQIELSTIYVSEDNPYFCSFSNCLYNKDRTTLICFPQALRAAEIPPTVTSLNIYALYGVNEKIAREVRQIVRENAERQGVPFSYVKDNTHHYIETWPYTMEYPVLTP